MTTETRVKTKVVDADGHYLEPPYALVDYIDPKFKDRAPHIIERDGKEYWKNNGWTDSNFAIQDKSQAQRATAVAGMAGIERWNQGTEMSMAHLNYTQMNPAATDPAARLTVMDEEHIDLAVLYPTMNLMWISDPDYHHAVNRALNDWLADSYVRPAKGRLFGVVNIVAVHDVDWAVAEITRCVKDYGFKAVFLRPCHANAEARWWTDYYDPIWQTCQDLDVAVSFHPFPGDMMYGSGRYFDMVGPEAVKAFGRAPVNHIVDMMHMLTGMISSGKLEQFPSLRLAVLESSGGWLISYLERMDHRYEHLGHIVPEMKMSPTEYFRRQCWISFDPEEAVLPLTVEWLGADSIIWGSDFPHPDAFYPNFVEMLNGKISGLSPTDQDKIRGLNALDFYKIKTG